jgi:hypothetical protein
MGFLGYTKLTTDDITWGKNLKSINDVKAFINQYPYFNWTDVRKESSDNKMIGFTPLMTMVIFKLVKSEIIEYLLKNNIGKIKTSLTTKASPPASASPDLQHFKNLDIYEILNYMKNDNGTIGQSYSNKIMPILIPFYFQFKEKATSINGFSIGNVNLSDLHVDLTIGTTLYLCANNDTTYTPYISIGAAKLPAFALTSLFSTLNQLPASDWQNGIYMMLVEQLDTNNNSTIMLYAYDSSYKLLGSAQIPGLSSITGYVTWGGSFVENPQNVLWNTPVLYKSN